LAEFIPPLAPTRHTVGMKSNLRLILGTAINLAGVAALASQRLAG
jgi:hypothetical protein